MIYFDNAATTKMSLDALKILLETSEINYGNASTHYSIGVKAKKALTNSRSTIAKLLNCDPSNIIFTSGGTESNNIVANSILKFCNENDEIIVSSIEHSSILEIFKKTTKAKIVFANPDKNGVITCENIKNVLNEKTKAVFIQFINNELGSLMPINDISNLCKENNIYLHVDAVQAVGHIDINIDNLGISSMSASAHKFNGPKGVGFLYISEKPKNLMFGGSQENGIRPGTENVPGICSMAAALSDSLKNLNEDQSNIMLMINYLETELLKIKEISLNCLNKDFHSILNFSIKNVSNEALINYLDLQNICVSAGSACDGKNFEKSHVLTALGLSDDVINSSIRISLSRFNTLDECKKFIEVLKKAIMILSI